MKKILIISYYYPPANFVGSERIASFAKHLYKFGVYPIIITRNWNPNQTNTYEKVLDNEFKHRIYKTYEEFYMPYIKSLRDKLFRYNGFVLSKVRRLLTIVEIIHFQCSSSCCERRRRGSFVTEREREYMMRTATTTNQQLQ